MKLEIPLVKSESMFCMESVVASTAKWLGRDDYPLMFAKTLGFGFDAGKARNDRNIGRYVDCGYTDQDIFDMCSKYIGIQPRYETYSGRDILEEIKNELARGVPVSFRIHKKYCPWHPSNQEDPYIMIVGCEGEAFQCIDVHEGRNETKALPIERMEAFYKENQNASLLKLGVRNEREPCSLDGIVADIKSTKYIGQDTIWQINDFAEFIDERLNFDYEKCNKRSQYHMPIFMNLRHILRARKLCSTTFRRVFDVTKEGKADLLSGECEVLGTEWNLVWSILQKAYFTSELKKEDTSSVKNMVSNVAKKLRKIAKKEEALMNLLMDRGRDYGIAYGKVERETIRLPDWDYRVCDLDKHLNNKAFAVSADNREGADLTGRKEYFIYNESLEAGITVMDANVTIPNGNHHYDNIACENQIIHIRAGVYKKVVFIGCSEWDESMEVVDMLFSNHKVKRFPFQWKDWYDVEGSTGETVWVGDAVDYKGDCEKRALFSKVISLHYEYELEGIRLPNNGNIHIFSIILIR